MMTKSKHVELEAKDRELRSRIALLIAQEMGEAVGEAPTGEQLAAL